MNHPTKLLAALALVTPTNRSLRSRFAGDPDDERGPR
jgi:hypothetical protein